MQVETTTKYEGTEVTVSADFEQFGDGTYNGLVKARGQEFAEGEALKSVTTWCRQWLATKVRAGLDDEEIAAQAKLVTPGVRKTEAQKAQEAVANLSPEERARLFAQYTPQGKAKAA